MKTFNKQNYYNDDVIITSPQSFTHSSSSDQFLAEVSGGVVEGEFLTAQVIDRWVALQVQEEVVVKENLLRLLLRRSTLRVKAQFQHARAQISTQKTYILTKSQKSQVRERKERLKARDERKKENLK